MQVSLAQNVNAIFPANNVIAIGDIHADADSFIDALVGLKVIDKNGNFLAKGKDIVLLGDFADKGFSTLETWNVYLNLEKQALANGARVHGHYGNHDLSVLMGKLKRMTPDDLDKFKIFHKDPIKGLQIALTTEPYKSMHQKWRGMTQIGDYLYVHAGIDSWMKNTSIDEVNSKLLTFVKSQQKKMISGLQGVETPPIQLPWELEMWEFDSPEPFPDNPFWSRELSKEKLTQKEVNALLDYIGVKGVVVGHTPTNSKNIEIIYDGKVIKTDSNISRGFEKGKISGIHINSNGNVKVYNDIERGIGSKLYRSYKQIDIPKKNLRQPGNFSTKNCGSSGLNNILKNLSSGI